MNKDYKNNYNKKESLFLQNMKKELIKQIIDHYKIGQGHL